MRIAATVRLDRAASAPMHHRAPTRRARMAAAMQRHLDSIWRRLHLSAATRPAVPAVTLPQPSHMAATRQLAHHSQLHRVSTWLQQFLIAATRLQLSPTAATPHQLSPIAATRLHLSLRAATLPRPQHMLLPASIWHQLSHAVATPLQPSPIAATPLQPSPAAATPLQPSPIAATPHQLSPAAATPLQLFHTSATPLQPSLIAAIPRQLVTPPPSARVLVAMLQALQLQLVALDRALVDPAMQAEASMVEAALATLPTVDTRTVISIKLISTISN